MALPASSAWHRIGEPYTSGSTREEDGRVVYTDPIGPTRVVLELAPEGLDFIIDHLPESDSFTADLMLVREAAKDAHWEADR